MFRVGLWAEAQPRDSSKDVSCWCVLGVAVILTGFGNDV